jgi:zinc protease
MRGTKSHDFQEIFDVLESVGASLGFDGGTHTTGFGGKALVEDLDILLDLLSEVVRYPSFPSEQVERLRAQLLTGLAIRAQDTGDMASLTFDQILYRNHPYRNPEDGYPETVQEITRDDIANFHRRHYGPRGMVITIVGGIDPQKAVEKVSNVLEDWNNPKQEEVPELPNWTPLEKVVRQKIDISGKFQSDVILGSAGPSRFSPDYLAAALGNSILGQFGMMGRIGDVVREQAGLAYYAYSGLGGGSGPAPWTVSAGVAPENVEQTIDLIIQEIRHFASEAVSIEELGDSQANFIGRLPLSLESNGGVASALINLERYNLGLDYYLRYDGLINSITQEQILDTANHYLNPDHLAVAIAGPG